MPSEHTEPACLSPELLLSERAWLLGLARALVGASDAEDLVQDAMVVALERPPAAGYGMRSWLAGIARNLAAGRRRKGALRAARELEREAERERRAPDTAEIAERTELEARVVQELLELREPFRVTLLLRYRGGLSAAEIARRTGVPEGTVRGRTKTGLDALRESMDRACGNRAAWVGLLAPVRALELAPAVSSATVLSLGVLMKNVALLCVPVALMVGALVLLQRGDRPEEDGPPVLPAAVGVELAEAGEAAASGQGSRAAESAVRADSGVQRGAVDSAGQGELAFALFDSAGAQLRARAGVLLLEAGSESLDVDGRGRLVLPDAPDAGVVRLVAERAGAWPIVVEVPTAAGEHPVAWPSGADVSLRLLEAGRAPERALELTLRRDTGWAGWLSGDEGRAVDLLVSRRLTTELDGTVELLDLPAGWRGWVELEDGWTFADGESASRLFGAEDDRELRLEVQRGPRIVGTLIDAETGEPLGDASVGVLLLQVRRATQCEVRTDAAGRFAWPLEPGLRAVRLQLGAGPGWVREELELEELPAAGDLDLGTLPVRRAPEVRVRVVGPRGGAVAGARLSEQLMGPERTVFADERGEARLGLASEDFAQVQVYAPGFELTDHSVSATESAWQVLELAPGLRLSIDVVDGDGAPIGGATMALALELPGSEREFRWDQFRPELIAGHLNAVGDGAGAVYLDVSADAEGHVEIGGLPGAMRGAISLSNPLGRRETAQLHIEPDRDGLFVGTLIDDGPQRWTSIGRVHTVDGVDIEGATLELSPLGLNLALPLETSTDAEGRFALPIPGEVEAGLLEVRARGFAGRLIAAKVEESSEPLDIALERERRITFTIQRTDGTPIESFRVGIQQRNPAGGSRSVHSLDRRGSEPFTLGEFDTNALDVLITVGRLRQWFEVPAFTDHAHIDVPLPARLSIDMARFDVEPGTPLQYTLLVAETRMLVHMGMLEPAGPDSTRAELTCPEGTLELQIHAAGEVVFHSTTLATRWGETLEVDPAAGAEPSAGEQ